MNQDLCELENQCQEKQCSEEEASQSQPANERPQQQEQQLVDGSFQTVPETNDGKTSTEIAAPPDSSRAKFEQAVASTLLSLIPNITSLHQVELSCSNIPESTDDLLSITSKYEKERDTHLRSCAAVKELERERGILEVQLRVNSSFLSLLRPSLPRVSLLLCRLPLPLVACLVASRGSVWYTAFGYVALFRGD